MHRLVSLCVLGLTAWAALWLLFVSSTAPRWNAALALAAGVRAEAIWTGVALLALALLLALTGLRRRDRERFLAFGNEQGSVTISTTAIGDYLARLIAEFPSVVRLQPHVLPRRGAVDIRIDLRVKAGSQVHELCELVQQRVREAMAEGLGIREVRKVTVTVRDIVSEHRPR